MKILRAGAERTHWKMDDMRVLCGASDDMKKLFIFTLFPFYHAADSLPREFIANSLAHKWMNQMNKKCCVKERREANHTAQHKWNYV